MNGNDLWRAMNYVNEEYLDDAEKAPERRVISWRPAAIAAVLACVIGAAAWMQPGRQAVPEAMTLQSNDAAVMRSIRAPEEMTVQVLSREDNTLVCTVVSSERYAPGTQLKIALPEEHTAADDAETLLRITYLPQEGEPLQALEITPEENVSDS